MKKLILFTTCLLITFSLVKAESPYTYRGLSIAAPGVNMVDEFVEFIERELAPAGVNLLMLRVDFNYEYKSRPELVGDRPLKESDIKKLVKICRENNIRLIPQVNLLGHQSWSTTIGKLLEVYPEFDETPSIELPETYVWPNPDGLYCKSYCPLHPDVHAVVFDLMDEITGVFETDAFHAGMDEVFYIGHDDCSRCRGRDPAELFAAEVTRLRNHLHMTGKELWIWGDRLIDGRTTGIGLWEGSYNNTHRAIDMIPKDVVINDWHYNRAHPTAVLFAAKGFRVLSCPWNRVDVAVTQDRMLRDFISASSNDMRPRYHGVMQTVWTSARNFLDNYYKAMADPGETPAGDVESFLGLSSVWNQ